MHVRLLRTHVSHGSVNVHARLRRQQRSQACGLRPRVLGTTCGVSRAWRRRTAHVVQWRLSESLRLKRRAQKRQAKPLCLVSFLRTLASEADAVEAVEAVVVVYAVVEIEVGASAVASNGRFASVVSMVCRLAGSLVVGIRRSSGFQSFE